MITIKNLAFNQIKMSLLATYTYQVQNKDFLDLFQKLITNKIENHTIQKGIDRFIKERKLDTDELFINKGILTNQTKDLIEITVIEYGNTFHVINYEVIEKLTDNKYKGISATGYLVSMKNYKRYDIENGVDFQLLNIHEMGYYSTYPSLYLNVNKYRDQIEIYHDEFNVKDLRNPLLKEVKFQMNELIGNCLPDFLSYKGDRIYVKQYSKELIDYVTNVLTANRYFSLTKENVELLDEILFFDSVNVITTLITEYILNQLRTDIIPIKEMRNLIEIIASIEGMPTNQKIQVENILDKIHREVTKDVVARKNYHFVMDMIESTSTISASTMHLKGRKGSLRELLVEMLGINPQTKKVYIVSQYLLMKYFSQNEEAKYDKKNKVINELIKLSQAYQFELWITTAGERKTDQFNLIKTNFKGVHGRYIIIISNEIKIIKLDAELEHFDEIEDDQIIFKDLSYMNLKDHRILPLNIIKIVGEIK